MKEQKELIKAKTKTLASAEQAEKTYKEALKAFTVYSGHGEDDYDEDIF